MEIGEEQERIVVEPATPPVPARDPSPEPAREPVPERAPEEEPVPA